MAWDWGLGFRGEELANRLRRAAPGLNVEATQLMAIIEAEKPIFDKLVAKAEKEREVLRRQTRAKTQYGVDQKFHRAAEIATDKFESLTAELEVLEPANGDDRKKLSPLIREMKEVGTAMKDWADIEHERQANLVRGVEKVRTDGAMARDLLRGIISTDPNMESVPDGINELMLSEHDALMPEIVDNPAGMVLALIQKHVTKRKEEPKAVEAVVREPDLVDLF